MSFNQNVQCGLLDFRYEQVMKTPRLGFNGKKIIMKNERITSRGTKCVANPAATNSLPFSLAPVKAKYSPAHPQVTMQSWFW